MRGPDVGYRPGGPGGRPGPGDLCRTNRGSATRRSASRGLEPEIDLTGPPTDPGISHLHAVLIAQPDGTWSVLDPGSSNGTQLNGTDVVNGVETPLQSGDRVCVGAWTVLTIQSP